MPSLFSPSSTNTRSAVLLGLVAQVLSCALLAGCASIQIAVNPLPVADTSQTEARASLFESVPKDHARVVVPLDAGTLVAVTQRRQRDAQGAGSLSQRLILAGDRGTTGENAVEITFKSTTILDNFMPLSDAEMVAASETQVPNHPMSLSDQVVANGLGRLAVATGQSNGESCVFAWQRVRPKPAGLLGGKQTAIDMQIRVCRTDRTLDQLVASLSQFVVIEDGEGDDSDLLRQTAFKPAPRDALSAAGAPDASVATTASVSPSRGTPARAPVKVADHRRAAPDLEARLGDKASKIPLPDAEMKQPAKATLVPAP